MTLPFVKNEKAAKGWTEGLGGWVGILFPWKAAEGRNSLLSPQKVKSVFIEHFPCFQPFARCHGRIQRTAKPRRRSRVFPQESGVCLLYTSDAADDWLVV